MKFIQPGKKLDITVFVREEHNGGGLRLATKKEIEKYLADLFGRMVNFPQGEWGMDIRTEIGTMILTNAPQRYIDGR